MNRRHRLPTVRLAFAITTIALVGIVYATLNKQVDPGTQLAATLKPKTTLNKEVYYGLPVRLRIPAISVDTEIEYVGLTPQGDMESPKGIITTGWYKFGAIPGDKGSAVIAGHVVGPRGEPGVFYNLKKLNAGDDLSVVDGRGQTIAFKVREIRAYDHYEQHSEVFSAQGSSHLNLITCAGDWDASKQQYLERLVVFADKTN
jgi:LPXTG-site transpeptidase (sortase) family protein